MTSEGKVIHIVVCWHAIQRTQTKSDANLVEPQNITSMMIIYHVYRQFSVQKAGIVDKISQKVKAKKKKKKKKSKIHKANQKITSEFLPNPSCLSTSDISQQETQPPSPNPLSTYQAQLVQIYTTQNRQMLPQIV